MDFKYAEFTRLIKENQGIVFKIARTYSSNLADFEDLKQEILLQLWKSFDSFKGDAKFSTWMYRVALNTSITIFKKELKKIPISEIELQQLKLTEESENEQIAQLYFVIQELNEIDKALVLLYLDDQSYKEISETLGITEVNARVKINRIKQKLKELVEKYYG